METNNSTEGEKSQGEVTPSNQQSPNQNAKESATRLMFLEYDRFNPGQHSVSAIIKEPGQKRGKVAARIYTEFLGDSKKPNFTAKDVHGNVIFSSGKLWEVKKNIRENASTLLERTRQTKQLVEKEAKAIGNKVVDEGKQFADQATDIITGSGREQELKNVRQRKVERNKGVELEP